MGYTDTIRKILSADFRNAPLEERNHAARDVITACALACAGLVLQPIPGLEQAILPVQVGMILALAHIFGKELDRKRAKDIVFDLAAITGVNILGRQALLTAAKVFLPFLGGALAAPYVFSVTWGTGYAAIHYLQTGGRPDRDKIRKIFEDEREKSRSKYSETDAKAHRPSETDLGKE